MEFCESVQAFLAEDFGQIVEEFVEYFENSCGSNFSEGFPQIITLFLQIKHTPPARSSEQPTRPSPIIKNYIQRKNEICLELPETSK